MGGAANLNLWARHVKLWHNNSTDFLHLLVRTRGHLTCVRVLRMLGACVLKLYRLQDRQHCHSISVLHHTTLRAPAWRRAL